jgi:hypothetical protein
MTKEEKQEARDWVMQGPPWTASKRRGILDYCLSDATALIPLLERMLPRILHDPRGLGRALLRGRYMVAVALMHASGIPIDVDWLDRLRSNWASIRLDLVDSVDSQYHVYEGGTFKAGRFGEYLETHGIPWPRTETGQLSLSDDTFKDQARLYPQLESLRQLRRHLSELRLEGIEVGSDGRNRCSLFPFGARTGRNTPSATKYTFGPSTWLRHLIKPEPGRALLYCDWSAQEIAIAAALSGDAALLEAIASGDPYMAFAVRAGLAPPEATRVTHPRTRELAKVTLLASNYGQGPRSLAARTGVDLSYAREILYRLSTTYPAFAEWSRKAVDHANLGGWTASVFGWPMEVDDDTRPTSLRNFPAQANGAEMLRLACIFATEAGLSVAGPVHDALLVESRVDELVTVTAGARQAMGSAARLVLGGLDVAVDVKVTTWPKRYSDPRGVDMWTRVTSLIEAQSAGGSAGAEGPTLTAGMALTALTAGTAGTEGSVLT